jgi:hypothetical protein
MFESNPQDHSDDAGPLTIALPSRPLGVTLLAFGVLMIAGINLIRAEQALEQWKFIAGISPALALYQALSGFLWSLAGFLLTWGLWRGRSWVIRLALWVAAAYTIYFWLDRLLLRRGLEPTNLPFLLGLSALIWGFVIWILSRPSARSFFHS